MKVVVTLALALAASASFAQDQEIQRALIQRDQQSAEFAARIRGADTSSLQQLHARQLLEVTTQPLQPELRPYQRGKMADERALVLPPPVTMVKAAEKPASTPLPLPGGPKHGVDPVPAQGTPY